jgi:TonB family protein
MKSGKFTALLPERKFNYRSLFLSFCLQSALIAVLVQTGVIKPAEIVSTAEAIYYTRLIAPIEPPTIRPVQPKEIHVRPVVAKLIMPAPKARISPPPVSIPVPVVEPPKVEMKIIAPTPVLPPVVQVGEFVTAEEPTLPKSTPTIQVQTGGFGDADGLKGDHKGKMTIASLGSFDMPGGPGHGNGTGGRNGKEGVVQSSGFGVESAAASAAKIPASQHDTGKSVEIIGHVKPDYTEEGRRLGIQGEVLLRVMFVASGQVRVLGVLRGLGHGLDEQAIHAAEKIQFKSAEHEGQLIDSEATVHIIFELAS